MSVNVCPLSMLSVALHCNARKGWQQQPVLVNKYICHACMDMRVRCGSALQLLSSMCVTAATSLQSSAKSFVNAAISDWTSISQCLGVAGAP